MIQTYELHSYPALSKNLNVAALLVFVSIRAGVDGTAATSTPNEIIALATI
jgi:hypothetical protein